MAGEMGNAAVSETMRAANTGLQAMLEILRFLNQIRYNRSAKGSASGFNKLSDKQLSQIKGSVSADKLIKSANQNKDSVVTLSENISSKQIKELEQLCKEFHIPFAAVGKVDNHILIRDLENQKAKLESKAERLYNEIEQLEQKREHLFERLESQELTRRTEKDDIELKKISAEIDEKKKQIDNLEYLSEDEKAEWHRIDRELNGDPLSNEKGLYNKQGEVAIMLRSKDMQRFLEVTKRLNEKQMLENVNKNIEAYKEKAEKGTITEEEKSVYNSLINKREELQKQEIDSFNKESIENVLSSEMKEKELSFDEIVDLKRENGLNKGVNEALNRIVKQNRSLEKPVYIADMANPDRYIEVSAEYNGKRTEHTYKVFKDGQEQVADKKFRTDGVFTDKYSLNANGKPKFIDDKGNIISLQGSDKAPKGSHMYWTALRQDMISKCGISKDVLMFWDKSSLEHFQTKYHERQVERTNTKNEHTEYDFAERLDIPKKDLPEIETNMLYTDGKISELQNALSNSGIRYSFSQDGNDTFIHNGNNKQITAEELRMGFADAKMIDKAQSGMMIWTSVEIHQLSQLENIQADLIMKSKNYSDNLARTTNSPKTPEWQEKLNQDYQEIVNLNEKREELVAKIQNSEHCLECCKNVLNNEASKEKKLHGANEDNIRDKKELHGANARDNTNDKKGTLKEWEKKIKDEQDRRMNDISKVAENARNVNVQTIEKTVPQPSRS